MSLVQKLFRRLKESFRRRDDQKRDVDYDEAFKRLSLFGLTSKDGLLLKKARILDKIALSGTEFLRIGKLDGEKKISLMTVKGITKSKAEEWQALIQNVLEGDTASLKVKTEHLDKRIENLDDQINLGIRYKQLLTKEKRWKFTEYLLGIGVLYLFAGLVLILADFPLSYSAAYEALRIPGTNLFGTYIDLPSLVGFGVVGATLYFKVYFDEFLNGSIRKSVFRFRKERFQGFVENATASNADVRKARAIWFLRLLLKTGILVLLVTFLVNMGIVRYDQAINDPKFHGSQSMQMVFILIALIFPFVGGILTAYGLQRIFNYWEYRKTSWVLSFLGRRSRRLSKRKSKIKGELERFEKYLELCKKESFINNIKNYFDSCYEHGYERSMIVIRDIYGFAKELRARDWGAKMVRLKR